jgi:hypothetical protein
MDTQNPYKWNVMIFLAGNNSLSEECVYGLTEVLDARINGSTAIFAQLNTGVHRGTFLNLREFRDRDQLHKQLNRELSEQRAASATKIRDFERRSFQRRIFDFVQQCLGTPENSHRADHYMLILAGHGNGILGEFLREDDRDVQFKKSAHMNLMNLGGLIEKIDVELLDGKKIDVLGMDSCLMAMTEIAYGVHNHVKVMIGAEGFEPMAGWPYHQIMEQVSEVPDDLNELGRRMVDEYIDFYTIYQAANLSA